MTPSRRTDLTVQIFVAATFAVAQPVYEYIQQEPVFLVMLRIGEQRLYLLVAALSFFLPAVLSAPIWFVDSRRTAGQYGSFILLILLWLISVFYLKKAGAGDSTWALAAAALAAYSVVKVLDYSSTARHFVACLTIAVIGYPLLFINHSVIERYLRSNRGSAIELRSVSRRQLPPVVMIIFDELPLVSLLDKDFDIDRRYYPNLAALAGNSVWYRNTSTVSSRTEIAVPAILSGRLPQRFEALPWYNDYPVNLFSLLGNTHELRVFEQITYMCPASLCGGRGGGDDRVSLAAQSAELLNSYFRIVLPHTLYLMIQDPLAFLRRSVVKLRGLPVDPEDGNVLAGGILRKGQWTDDEWLVSSFTEALQDRGKPALYFLHVTLPHSTYRYFPDGQLYLQNVNESLFSPDVVFGPGDRIQALEYYRRHLLQTRYVDRLLGRIVKRLKESGLYERSILILTSDHGNSYIEGQNGRQVQWTNAGEILIVPLFIKFPGQREGKIDDKNVQTIDILPTLTAFLGLEAESEFSGRDINSSAELPERLFVAKTENSLEKVSYPVEIDLRPQIARKLRYFGSGDQFANSGPCPDFLGRTFEDVGALRVNVQLRNQDFFQWVIPNGPFIPALVEGELKAAPAGSKDLYVIAVNGAVRGVFNLADRNRNFSVLVPQESFLQGKNEIAVGKVPNGLKNCDLEEADDQPVTSDDRRN